MRLIRPKFIVLFALLVFTFVLYRYSFAEEPTELYNLGNQAYRNDNHTEAIEYYLECIEMGGINPAVFYNLGNAYFKTNEIGKSILYYNKALILAPRDKSIKSNLEYAKLLTFDKIESIYDKNFLFKFYYKFLLLFSSRELYLTTLVLSILITITLIIFIVTDPRNRKKLFLRLFIIFCVIELLVIATFLLKSSNIWLNSSAIVMVSKLDVTSAPNPNSELLFTIHEGTKVAIDESRSDWVKILLEDGRHGWVPEENISNIKDF